MSIYKNFCVETFDQNGALSAISMHYPEGFNFAYDVIDVLAAREPQRRALVWCGMDGESSRVFTFGDIGALSSRAANVLKAAGIGRGDRVMVVLKRHPEYWYVLPALHKLGAVAVPVTHMLTVSDFRYRLEYGEIRAVICTGEDGVLQRLEAAAEALEAQPLFWTVGEAQGSFKSLIEAVAMASPVFPRVETRASDPMLMYFTSGTTGYPKAVIHDHTYPLSHIITAKYWQQVEDGGLHFTVAETGWAKAAWGKMYGQWLCGSAVMVYDFDNFDPKQLTNIINRFGVTSFCAPPTVYRYLVKKGMSDMPGLHHASTAGEALSPEVFERFREKTGLELMEGFGQTESALILANFLGSASRPGSLGKPSPLYNVDILNSDGRSTEDGELGELVIIPPEDGRQLGIFSAYFKDEALYRHVWRGGVYHTGDIVWRDSDGYFWFHGRADDVIKSCGYRVGPYEIEDVLSRHPAVLECSVVGIRDSLRGQAIRAYVVAAAGFEPCAELAKELKEFANSRLAEYKWIKQLEFVDEMPKTISGKIRKTELRKMAEG